MKKITVNPEIAIRLKRPKFIWDKESSKKEAGRWTSMWTLDGVEIGGELVFVPLDRLVELTNVYWQKRKEYFWKNNGRNIPIEVIREFKRKQKAEEAVSA